MRHRPNKTQNLGHPLVPIAAAVFAIVLCVGAQERPPNATPPAKSKAGSGIGKLYTGQKAGEPKQTSPAEPQVIPCNQASPCYVIQEPQAKNKAQQAKDDSLDTLDRRYMWATIVEVVGAFTGLVVLIWQTIISRTTANAAKASADALINSERAWLEGELVPDEEAKKIAVVRYRIKITNNGKTPAKILGYETNYGCFSEGKPFSCKSLSSGQAREVHFLLGSDKSETLGDPIDLGIFAECPDDGAYCVTITYEDVITKDPNLKIHHVSFVYRCKFLFSSLDRIPRYDDYT